MKKKILSFLTSAVMAAVCLGGGLSELTSRINLVNEPLTAKAATYGDLSYTAYTNYVEITDCDSSAVSVEIPVEIDGLPVTSIGYEAFSWCLSLESITIPDSVTSIGDDAFDFCRSLENVYISNLAAWCNIIFSSAASNPLAYANNLYINNELATDVIIPDSVTSIESYTFFRCSSLASITIPDSVTSIGNEAFYNCSSLASITIPDSVTSIGNEAFSSCSSLASITIPDSVTSIGSSAFSSCSSLASITIPDSVTSIGSSAFSSCSSLASITIPDSVTSIGYDAFYGCSSLASITIPDSVTSIESRAFYNCTSLTDVYVSDIFAWNKIEFNGTSANPLEYAENLYIEDKQPKSITIPEGTMEISSNFFYKCKNLQSITIPDSVMSIGNKAFYNCTSLESITIPDSVTSIGEYAFYNCSSLESITIPDSVTSIGEYAFYNCSSLESVYISDIESWCNIEFGYSYSSPLYYANNLYINNELATDVIITDGVTSIKSYAFYGCSSLASVTIGNSVTFIGYEAFSGCSSLASVTIPDSVTSIGGGAFYGCSNLESISIADGITSIGDSAFYGCNKILQITIPATVETIGKNAVGYSSEGNIISNFKVYGVSGTAAETYALEKGITFVDINNMPYLNKENLVLNVGDTFVLEVKNFSGDIVWGSNDSSIATVKDGCVSGLSTGETIVYAIIGDSVLKCSVIVQPAGTVTTTVTTTSAATSTTVTTTSVVSTTASSSGTTGSTTTQTTTVPVTTVSTNSKTTAVTTTATTVSVTTTSSAPETTTSETVPVTTVNTDIFDVKENNGTIIIVNCDNLVINVVVPETIDGKTVSKVNDFAFSSEEIESVQFENPDIEIADSATTINEDAVIYGYWDSTAHEYAEKYNRTFVSLDGEPDYLPGDISGNDKIDLYDAIEICKSIMGMRTFTDAEKKIADYNGDGKVDLYDAIGIAKKLLEK